MNRARLHRDQLFRLQMSVSPILRYLNRLCSRIAALEFPADDPLRLAAVRARDAVQALYEAADQHHAPPPEWLTRQQRP